MSMTSFDPSQYVDFANNLIGQATALKDKLDAKGADSERLLAAAMLCEMSGCLAEASHLYKEMTAGDDATPEALGRLALVQVKLGQHSEARRTAVRLVNRTEKQVVSLKTLAGTPLHPKTILADATLAAGDRDIAADLYAEAFEAEPTDRRAGSQLVQLHVERGQLEEARAIAKGVTFEPGRKPLQALLQLSGQSGGIPGVTSARFAEMAAENAA